MTLDELERLNRGFMDFLTILGCETRKCLVFGLFRWHWRDSASPTSVTVAWSVGPWQ